MPITASVPVRPTITHCQLLQTAPYLLNHTKETKPFHLSWARFQHAVGVKSYQQQEILVNVLFLCAVLSALGSQITLQK